MELSDRAKQKRLDDMTEVVNRLDTSAFLYIMLIGLILLVIGRMKKMSPLQRAALIATAIITGGASIVLLMMSNNWGIALIVMFILGWIVSELSRL